jgi:hypothetical protein
VKAIRVFFNIVLNSPMVDLLGYVVRRTTTLVIADGRRKDNPLKIWWRLFWK